MRSDIARLRRTIGATSSEDALLVDLNARNASLAIAGASLRCRSVIHATDALAEWHAIVELRPPGVHAFEAGAAALIASVGATLDLGWRSSCAACGQHLRIAAWRWDDLQADEDPARHPTARRATCQACRALGRRNGDSSALVPQESAERVTLDEAHRVELLARLGGEEALARWSPRQAQVFAALSAALDALIEPAPVVIALRAAVAEAALATARPLRASRGWWEVAPWQALAESIDARRRELLTSPALPRELVMGADLTSMRFPGLSVVISRASSAARTALAALGSGSSRETGSPPRVALVRVRVGDALQRRALRAEAARWAAPASDRAAGSAGETADTILHGLEAADATAVAAALARVIVGLNSLLAASPLLLIETSDSTETLAGVLSAVSLAGGEALAIERFTSDEGAELLEISVRLRQGAEEPRTEVQRVPLERVVADLLVERSEPTAAARLLPAFALQRSREGGLLDPAALAHEFAEMVSMRDRAAAAGTFARVVAAADGRIFIDGHAERERLGRAAGDRADELALAAADAAGDPVLYADRLAALDAGAADPEPAFRSTLLAAYVEERGGNLVPRLNAVERLRLHGAHVALLLETGARMGLHAALAPRLASREHAGRSLASRVARDPLDTNLPLRARSDRAAYDAIDLVLYSRGRSVLFCEVILGPLPLAELLLQRHAAIPNDREVARILVVGRALIPLVQQRLARDERLDRAWAEQNWHVLAIDQLESLGREAAPRLTSLESRHGFEPAAGAAAQLDLGTFGWESEPNDATRG